MKLTKITSGCKKIQHYSGNDYLVITDLGSTLYSLRDNKFVPKINGLYFNHIEIFNNDWYKIYTANNTKNIINRETGNVFSTKFWQHLEYLNEYFFLALDFKSNWHVISFDGKKDVIIPNFYCISEVDEKLLFIKYAEDKKYHFIETDNFTEVYKKGIINESESVEFNPTKFINLSKDYLLIQNDPKDCFVISKQTSSIIKQIKNAKIDRTGVLNTLMFDLRKCSLINPNKLEFSPLYCDFLSLNKNYCFAIIDEKKCLGTIMNLTDFSLPDPTLIIPYSDIIKHFDSSSILYKKDDDLYILN